MKNSQASQNIRYRRDQHGHGTVQDPSRRAFTLKMKHAFTILALCLPLGGGAWAAPIIEPARKVMDPFIWTRNGADPAYTSPRTPFSQSIPIKVDVRALKQRFPGEEFSFKWSMVENPNSKFVISLKSYPAKYPPPEVFRDIPKDLNTHDLILFVNSVSDPGPKPAPWKVVIKVFRKMTTVEGIISYSVIKNVKGYYTGETRRANRRREPYMDLNQQEQCSIITHSDRVKTGSLLCGEHRVNKRAST